MDRILEKGLFVTVERTGETAALRLSVMASHTKSELAQAARTLRARCPRPCARPPPAARWRPPAGRPAAGGVFDGLAEAA